ncbi:MAG: S8 family serine peptidase [Gammaproteobacteria bacterium]|nr:S8 family serine peptidase [Gammaproteobacteria bacterium]
MVSKIKTLSAATVLALTAGTVMADDSRYIIQVDNAKKGVVKALAKKLGAEVNVDANGFFAATFEGKSLDEVKGLLNNPHVKFVEADSRRVPLALFNDDAGDPTQQQLTPYAIYQSQADQVSLQLNNAKKVCVIDSGIAREQGETGGYNADFDWSAITGTNDSGTGDWFRDGGPHGTHVAGTIAAADNGFGVIGMAPGNPLHIVKVFNAAGWGYSSDLAKAAQVCADNGSSIISMSLGGGGANSTEENAFNSFTANGGLVLAAAGNDGNNVRSYPAGYKSVMMIGANDSNNNIASFSQFPSNTKTSGRGKNVTTETDDGFGVEVTVGGVDTLSTYPSGGASIASMTAGGVGFAASAMENNGEASGSTYFMGTAEATDSNAAGKICVIDRGVISFYDKVNNCESSGGIGAIIINNEAGMLYGTLGTTNDTTIPAVGAALEDRTALTSASTASVKVGASDYGYMSGTSMATPGASGIAALVWSNFPTCSGTEIREAMKATAEDQGAAGRDDYFGYGIVKAKALADYLTANGCSGGDNGGGNNGGGTGGDLTADGSRSKGGRQLDVNWTGFSSNNVDITITWTGGTFNDTTANDGSESYTGDKNTSYTVTVCETGTSTCASSFTL